MASVGIASRRSDTLKTPNMFFFCLPELVLASNVCLGFGFLCCFSVLFGALGGLVGFFVCLFFSVVGFFSPFSLAATASLEPTV